MEEENVSISFMGSTDDEEALLASITFDIPTSFTKEGYDSVRCEMTEQQIQALRDALSAVLAGMNHQLLSISNCWITADKSKVSYDHRPNPYLNRHPRSLG